MAYFRFTTFLLSC